MAQKSKNSRSSAQQDDDYLNAMQNYQNIKDQMQGGVQKMNQQKNNPLPPRGVPAKSDLGKSPNYNQNAKQNSKSEYDYDIEDDGKSPFSAAGKKSIQQNKIDSSISSSNKGNNNNIYNKSTNNSRNNTAQYPYRQPSRDDFDNEDDEYGENKYSVENYANNQQRKPATTSGAYSKGQRGNEQQRRSINRDEDNEDDEDNMYTNKDEYEQYNNRTNQRKGTLNSHNRQNYDDDENQEDDERYSQPQATNKRSSSINKKDQDSGKGSNNRMISRYQKVEEGLTECPEGCGRTFNEFALEKHVKVCKKVFQDKRKAYDITQKRQIVPVNEQAKQDDEQKRNEIMRKQKEMHECPDCGRTFRYDIFEKHVKICVRVFTKKNRENSLNRKASLNVTGSNQPSSQNNIPPKLPPTQLVKKGSSIQNEAEADPKNMKKPPLKRNPSQNEKKEEATKKPNVNDYDETPVGGRSKNTWDDTPVGGGSKSNAQWDEYPSSTPSVQSKGGKSTTAHSEASTTNPWESKPKVKKSTLPPQNRPAWNDDWNSAAVDDNNEDFTSKNREYDQREKQKQEQKNYNFNKKLKSAQSGSKYQIDNPSDSNFDNNNYEQEEERNYEDQYVYSKPNIGKKIIHSSKKSPMPESSKVQRQQPQQFNRGNNDYDDQEQPPTNLARNRNNNMNKQTQNKYDDNRQNEEEEESSQYSKPFLKKNQGNQAVARGKQPPPSSQQQQQQQMKGNSNYSMQDQSPQINDIPINKNNDFNRQLMEMEQEAQEQDFYECPEGCGRKFSEAVLEKHAKICKKVFQQKRKVFNSAGQRSVPDEEGNGGGSIPAYKPPPPMKKAPPKKQAPSSYDYEEDSRPTYGSKPAAKQGGGGKPPQNPFDKKPQSENTKVGKKQAKWKLQSEAFRAVLRQGRGDKSNSEYDNAITKEAFQSDDFIQCEYCGRKFNEKAAERHIPFCKTKSQLNQMKQGGKAKLNLTSQKSSTPSSRKY